MTARKSSSLGFRRREVARQTGLGEGEDLAGGPPAHAAVPDDRTPRVLPTKTLRRISAHRSVSVRTLFPRSAGWPSASLEKPPGRGWKIRGWSVAAVSTDVPQVKGACTSGRSLHLHDTRGSS
jgi:hypothetical protein